MQTPNIQIPSLNAEALSAPKGKLNLSGNGTDNLFKQALSREMDQRQANAGDAKAPAKNADRAASAPAASRSSAPKQAAPAKPVQQQQNTKADATEQAKPAAAAEAPAAAAPAKTASSDTDKDSGAIDSAASDAQAAQAADPLADMLALVAAYNQPPPASAPVADSADAAIASASTAGASAASLAAAAAAATAASLAAGAAANAPAEAGKADAAGPQDAGKAALDAAALQALQAGADTDADTVKEFKATLVQTGSTAQAAADAATAAAAAAATQAAADGAVDAEPVIVTTMLAPPGTKPTAAPLGDKMIEAKPVDVGVSLKTGADVINRIETKAAPADDNQPQLAQTRQQPTDPLATATATATATKTATSADADFAAALKEAAPAAVAPAAAKAAQDIARAAGAVPTDKLSSRVGTQGWDQQLGQKIIFMAAGGEQSATMELNPPDLGPLQVVLSVNKDQATAAFSSAAPEVRQALEAALPRLKEMMAEAGIQLGSATVSAGMSDQSNGFNQQAASAQAGNGNGGNGGNRGGGRFGGDGGDHGAEAQRAAPPPRRVPAGAVDTFA